MKWNLLLRTTTTALYSLDGLAAKEIEWNVQLDKVKEQSSTMPKVARKIRNDLSHRTHCI